MLVIAISRTGHATAFGPFEHAGECHAFALEHLAG
jgi:hypothetical protein